MDELIPWLLLFAQDAGGGKAAADAPAPLDFSAMMLPILAAIALYYFMFIRPERRKQTDHRSQLDSLKKNDRIVTIGGIYGVVMNVQRDADEVTLKVDEATNTKIRVTLGAIARVVSEESPAPPADKPA